jgi:hypothetical protein
MISSTEKPACPVCRQSDKVSTLQVAFNQGVERFAPPPVPTPRVSIFRTMVFNMLIVGLCIFFVIILIGSESFGYGFNIGELVLVLLTLTCIVTALVLSYLAFTKVVKGDQEVQKLYPGYDRAMAEYNRLRYCSRDDVIFDPETGKTISEEALAAMIKMEVQQEQHPNQATLARNKA